MNTFTAQELADFYQKVSHGGEVQYRHDAETSWLSNAGGPYRYSTASQWRIKPTKKVIDMSALISGIDCQFSDDESFRPNFLGTLTDKEGLDYHKYSGDSGDGFVRHAKYCRPRMNHIHAWLGGECPLPEGFMVKVWYFNPKYHSTVTCATGLIWGHNGVEGDIIAFEVFGLADGYVMPWEQD